MASLTPDDLARWRAEIDLGVEFRDKEFGTYRAEMPGSTAQTTLAGVNLDLFEQGARDGDGAVPPLNLEYPIVKLIVPSLFYQYPRATALPASRNAEASEDAFYVSELINLDLRNTEFRFKDTMQQVVLDSFLLGFVVVKVGYATEFGPDILPTERETKQTFRDRMTKQMQQVVALVTGQPPPVEPDEPEQVQADSTIRSEAPYLTWISPFDFVVDPRARDLTDARWVAQRIRRTLADIKRDRRYGKSKYELEADAPNDDRLQPSFVEEFQTADVWEVHVKDPDSDTGVSVFSLACTQQHTKPLMQPKPQEYDIAGWQFEWLTPNKHGHRLYPVSAISIIRPMLDLLNSSFISILEQVDKFQAKVAYNSRVSPEGELALDTPILGARVKVDGQEDVRGAVAVISMNQVAADMVSFVNQLIDIILILVGVTRAQFTGITQAQTATEAQLGQGGQNLRRTDETNTVATHINRVVTKYWRVKAQFQDLTAIDLPQEGTLLNPDTGISQSQWYPQIDQPRADRLKKLRYQVTIEVGSTQKPNLEIIRAQFIEALRMLMEPQVTQGLALEGKRLSATEGLRQLWKFFEDYGLTNLNKLVVPVQDPMLLEALKNYNPNAKPSQNGNGTRLTGAVPTFADQASAAAGEKGQGAPLV